MNDRRINTRHVIQEQIANEFLETIGVRPSGQIQRNHIGVDVNPINSTALEQATGEFIGWTVAKDFGIGEVTLVPHSGDAAIDLEAHATWIGTWFLYDGNWLSHSNSELTRVDEQQAR